MLYEIPVITGVVSFLQWVNTITYGWFGASIVIGFFLVMFLSLKGYRSEKGFAASIYLSTILCFLLFLIELTAVNHLFLCGIGTIFSIFVLRGRETY